MRTVVSCRHQKYHDEVEHGVKLTVWSTWIAIVPRAPFPVLSCVAPLTVGTNCYTFGLEAAPPERLVLSNLASGECVICCGPGEKLFRSKVTPSPLDPRARDGRCLVSFLAAIILPLRALWGSSSWKDYQIAASCSRSRSSSWSETRGC